MAINRESIQRSMVNPEILKNLGAAFPTRRLPPGVSPVPVSLPSPGPAPAPPAIPAAPADNPFAQLPFPSPGDRIRADDFKTLSRCLGILADLSALTGTLCGHTFGEAKLVLGSQHYEVRKAMTVFGTVVDATADSSLDDRKVVQVVPTQLGDRGVIVILTEAVETHRLMPNLIGLTHKDASIQLRSILADATFSQTPITTPTLVGLSLAQASAALR